jgi:opacity protein-like surface antigen
VLANSNPSSDMKVTTLMANFYYDFNTQSDWTPFIGFGIGKAHVKFATSNGLGNTDSTDNETAWQGMFGLTYSTRDNPDSRWLIGYRYLSLNKPTFSSPTGDINLARVHEHALEVGLQYSF